jgi:hypothetical protein
MEALWGGFRGIFELHLDTVFCFERARGGAVEWPVWGAVQRLWIEPCGWLFKGDLDVLF